MSIQTFHRYADQVSLYVAHYLSQRGRCENSECGLETAQQCQRELACENYQVMTSEASNRNEY